MSTRPAPVPPAHAESDGPHRGTLNGAPLRSHLRTSWADSGPGPSAERAEPGGRSPSNYLRAIRAHLWLVVAVTLAVLVAAVAWNGARGRTYQASSDVLVNPLPADDPTFLGLPIVRDTGDPTRTLQTAATLIDSAKAAGLTAQRLGHGWTQRRIQEAIEVSPQGQSSIVEVTAKGSSAAEAAHIANVYVKAVLDTRETELRPLIDRAVAATRAQLARAPRGSIGAQTLADRVRQLENVRDADPTLSVSQVASPPEEPSGIGLGIIIVLALVLGLALGAIAALVADLIRPRRISEEDELLGLYRLPVLARIPALPRRRRGAPDSPLAIPPMVREGFRTLQVQLELQPGRHRSILVTSASSADGKTTSAVNFALELVGAGQKVVLMDLDLRKPDVGRALEVAPRAPLASLLDPKTRLEDALVDVGGISGLRVLPITQGDGFPVIERITARLPELVNEALAIADYVIIDTAPLGEVSDALKMTSAVDDVLVVARLNNTRRMNFELLRDLLERTRHTPTGLVVIGTSPRVMSSYYYYGYGESASPVASS
jgi:capsular exopolysaccharide synthesis family protein